MTGIVKTGLLHLNMHYFSYERCIALILVTAAVIFYIWSDRREFETSEADRASMHEQQGGDKSRSHQNMHGYNGDWEWDTADEDGEELKLLLAQEEDQSLGFIIEVNSGSDQLMV